MVKNFSDIVDYKFTSSMEDSLDSIEEGNTNMEEMLGKFYGIFSTELEKAEATISKEDITVPVE